MAPDNRTREDLLAEIEELRYRLDEAEETLRAIGSGEVDALVVSGGAGEQVFTLKGAEQPYRVLVESMNEGAATLAVDGTILYCNNCLAAMLQVPLERLIGTRLDAYAAPADRPVLAARLECCTLDCSREEIALINGEGNAVPVLFSCFYTDLSAGGGISVVVTDLTQQKRNEEIMASERLARSIIEQAGEAIIVCGEDGRVIRASLTARRLCGQNPLLKPFDELFPLRISETECLFSVLTPLHGGCYESVEVEFNQADDEVVHLLLNATPLINDLNRIIGCVMSLVDISERKKAEEALRESEARLQAANEELQAQSEELQAQSEELKAQSEEIRTTNEKLQSQNQILAKLWDESERAGEALAVAHAEVVNDKNRLEAVMKALPVGLAILDAQGGNISINSAFDEVWGGPCAPVRIIDDYAAYQAWWTDTGQQVQPHEWASARAVRHGETIIGQEMQIRRFDGTHAFVLNSAAPILDAEGRITGCAVAIMDITERKKAEEALKRSEALYRGIGESIDYGVWVCSPDGSNTYASESFLKMVGITQEQCSNFGWGDVLHPDDAERTIASWKECVRTGGTWDIEHRFRGRDGQWHHVLARGVPVRNEHDEIICWAGINLDISQLKQTEEALRKSEERLRLVLQASSMGTFEVDLLTGEGLWNATEFELLGLLPGDVIPCPENFFRYVHPDDVELLQAKWEEALVSGKLDEEFRVVRADGEVRWLAGRGEFISETAKGAETRGVRGQTRRFLGVNFDITARKQVEEALKKLNQELENRVAERTEELAATIVNLQVEIAEREKAEERALRLNRLYAVLSETNQAIVRTRDRDTLFNDFCRIAVQDGNFTLAWVGLVDEERGELKVVAADGATGYLDGIRITVDGEPTGLGPTGISIREGTYYICNDFLGDPITRPWHERGRAHGIRASASVALKQEGGVIGSLTLYADKEDFFDAQQVELLRQMGADVSFALDNIVRETRSREAQRALQEETAERRKLEQQLLQSQKMESIGLLAGGVAHDFNNLLTGIGGYAQIIQDSVPTEHELQESVAQMMAGVVRAAELTRSLLAFSRKQELNRKPVMIDGILDKAGKFIRRVIGEDIEFRTAFGGNDLLVLVDTGQIEQVLLNLAINARDAMPQGGCLTISISRTIVKEGSQRLYDLPSSGNYARISVADTGSGIDRTTMERIFEPFYTTKAVGKGTGLGLSIVHGIIKQHDGSILVSSEPGRGATFDIYLPLIEEQESREETKMSAPVAGGTETLLIAEDEEIVKTLLKRILEKVGYRVVVAADGNEALARFREHDDIALVLSDVVMPGKNGKEILTEIREMKPGMKFIFLSGYTADIIRERGMGVVEKDAEIITKPFSKNDLLLKVREMLDRD
jgi:PAS domain S-box-containing protein